MNRFEGWETKGGDVVSGFAHGSRLWQSWSKDNDGFGEWRQVLVEFEGVCFETTNVGRIERRKNEEFHRTSQR